MFGSSKRFADETVYTASFILPVLYFPVFNQQDL